MSFIFLVHFHSPSTTCSFLPSSLMQQLANMHDAEVFLPETSQFQLYLALFKTYWCESYVDSILKNWKIPQNSVTSKIDSNILSLFYFWGRPYQFQTRIWRIKDRFYAQMKILWIHISAKYVISHHNILREMRQLKNTTALGANF